MRVHDLAPSPGAKKSPKRVARGIGGKGGKTAGRGTKGQRARNTVARGFEGGQMPLYRRVPKLKHFTVINPKNYTVINVAKLSELKAGSTVNIDTLVKDGLVTNPKAPLKVLGNGELSVKLTVQAAAFTASARQKIEAAGGTCEEI